MSREDKIGVTSRDQEGKTAGVVCRTEALASLGLGADINDYKGDASEKTGKDGCYVIDQDELDEKGNDNQLKVAVLTSEEDDDALEISLVSSASEQQV